MTISCSCVVLDIDEWCNNIRTSTPRARKEHHCCECRDTISKGQIYLNEVTTYNGELTEYKTCQTCKEIRDEFFCEGYYYGEVMEGLKEYIFEVRGDISESCLADLSSEAREKVCEIIEDYWRWDDEE